MQTGNKFKVGDKVEFTQEIYGLSKITVLGSIKGIVELSSTYYEVETLDNHKFLVDEESIRAIEE